jgi:cellulose synthase operon protein C
MAGQIVLTARARAAQVAAIALAASLVCARASADNVDDDDLQRPLRLTVGVADDLLGQLGPDGKTLYFLSNRDTTNQVFAQSMIDGRARPLFDDGGDVTWPRVSPDGRSLLYISFRESAAGQLCIRRLPEGDGRRCLADRSAALQAEWIDHDRIVLVSRQSIKGDLRILEVTIGGALSARSLVDRNMTSPAVSPDGRWLVYVPVARTVASVGPAFAAHATPTLEAIPLASASSTRPAKIALQLPGQTGQPTFARDGRSLYVVQFFTDTNHDGAIDAGDHGVLFRVPISFTGETPVAGPPEQLTETSWNCEYPAPTANRLIATCSQDASLDVYSLPLDGEVPADWTMPMLVNAIDDADTLVEEQLLTSRRLARETTPTGRRRAMLALAMVHLEREEFRAAEYYAEEVDTLRDEATAGISLPLRMLVEERRAERRREQGRLTEGFVAEAQGRLEKLHPDATESPMAEDLTHLARSEIFDALGDLAKARSELEAVTVDETTPAPIVLAYYRHADAFYRKLDDREALVEACKALAANSALRPDEQLYYARAAVRAMIRGLPYADADARLARERAGATARDGASTPSAARSAPEAELVFAIDLARAVLAIRDSHTPQAVGDALLALYAAQARPGRRRALITDAVQRADDVDADDVLGALVQRDIRDVKRGTHERGEAEDVFERLILARAYERAAAKRYDEARADFDAVAEQTGSYEAIVGAIDMRLKKGEGAAAILAWYERSGNATATAHFARAYVLARELPKLDGEAHARAAAAALAALDASWSELKEERVAQALFGSLLHEEYLQTGDLGTAEKANVHYLIALELVGDNARFRAMILGELGLLHTDVGNYRIALGYLLDRDKLPYTDNAEGLDVLVSKAQAILHVGRATDAASAADASIAMIDRNPKLATYRPLALDWAAVANLAAGRFARALALYGEEIPFLDASRAPLAERNRIVARISRAAAAVGAGEPARALPDLDYVDGRLEDAKVAQMLRWPHATAEHVVRAYRLIAAGLRATANRKLGRLEAEAKAIEAQRAILEERFGETSRGEIVKEEMLAEAQLAINASQRHDATATGTWLARALAHGDDLRARANGVTDKEQLDVIWLAAELTMSMGGTLVPDLPKRIEAASVEMAGRREPALRSYERWFEIYGALVSSAAVPAPRAPTPSPSPSASSSAR